MNSGIPSMILIQLVHQYSETDHWLRIHCCLGIAVLEIPATLEFLLRSSKICPITLGDHVVPEIKTGQSEF